MASEKKTVLNKLLQLNTITVCSYIFVEAMRSVDPEIKISEAMREFHKYCEWTEDDYCTETLIRKYYYIRPYFLEHGHHLKTDAKRDIFQQVLTSAILSVYFYFWSAGMQTSNFYDEQITQDKFNKFLNL